VVKGGRAQAKPRTAAMASDFARSSRCRILPGPVTGVPTFVRRRQRVFASRLEDQWAPVPRDGPAAV